jgi:uncharacterized protein YciI
MYNIFFAQTVSVKQEKKQFLYLLRLEKSMRDTTAWTAEKQQVVAEHFARLQKMLNDGYLILAGKTLTDLKTTFGIVIYEADSIKEAEEIAGNDPAVKAGIMSVEVFPFKTALIKEGKSE